MITGWFINLGPSTTTIKEANADIKTILETEPDFLFGVEAIGKGNLPDDPDCGKIRMRSPLGRANIFAYTRNHDPKPYWHDMNDDFTKEPGKGPGRHPARSFVAFNFKRVQMVVAHHPPAWPGTDLARKEHATELRHTLAPWTDLKRWVELDAPVKEQMKRKARMLTWDCNMRTITQRKAFAESVDGWLTGETIDCAISRNITVEHHEYHRGIGPHRFATDHPWGAFKITFKVS